MDRLLFGDNQFLGVNHMSEEKARASQMRFQDTAAVVQVLDDARAEGVSTFMCTTHDRIREICDLARAHPDRYVGMTWYPCMPYAHKYANAVTEHGMIGALRRFTPESGAWGAAMRGTSSLARHDIEGLITLLIEAEMTMFAGLSTPVIWLQNVVVDLLLGLGARDAFRIFADVVRERYQAEPGFITMNLPLLLDTLDTAGIEDPLVCASINKLGFRMSGGIDGYHRALAERPFRAVAMSVFASGAIRPDEAIEWVCSLPNIASVVFGASSRANIAHTRRLVDQYWPAERAVDA